MLKKIRTLTLVLFLGALPLLSACADPVGPPGTHPINTNPVECEVSDTQAECEP